MLVSINNDTVITRPIASTIKRETQDEDKENEQGAYE